MLPRNFEIHAELQNFCFRFSICDVDLHKTRLGRHEDWQFRLRTLGGQSDFGNGRSIKKLVYLGAGVWVTRLLISYYDGVPAGTDVFKAILAFLIRLRVRNDKTPVHTQQRRLDPYALDSLTRKVKHRSMNHTIALRALDITVCLDCLEHEE